MLISKFDLYRNEWLDLVFDNRNKEYGAYNLRHEYAGTMVRAMGITFFSIAVLCGASIILRTEKPIFHITQYDSPIPPPNIPPIKKIEPPKPPSHVKAEPLPPVQTTRVVPPTVVPDDQAEKPIVNTDIKGAIGPETVKGPPGSTIPVDPAPAAPAGPDESIHQLNGVDVMPEPVGGLNAWNKFLGKNLRFPAIAQDDGASGRVFVSFVVEKDGHLSNINIEKAAGHGFDEEAARVLKLAKAWKPGMQNGQPVRVRYIIPINFQNTIE